MDKESVEKMLWDSLYGYSYILKRENSQQLYIQTVLLDVKYKLKNENTGNK